MMRLLKEKAWTEEPLSNDEYYTIYIVVCFFRGCG